MAENRNLCLKPLTIKEVKKVYKLFMTHDFPRAERKPLRMITKSLKNGNYECLGFFEGSELLSYAFFYKYENFLLFDYFATVKEKRNEGIGTEVLNEIGEYYKSSGGVFGEVEDPAFATDESSETLMKRRFSFYLRNGFKDTGLRVELYKVNYIIIEFENVKSHTEDEMRRIYRNTYMSMLPKKMYDANVSLSEQEGV